MYKFFFYIIWRVLLIAQVWQIQNGQTTKKLGLAEWFMDYSTPHICQTWKNDIRLTKWASLANVAQVATWYKLFNTKIWVSWLSSRKYFQVLNSLIKAFLRNLFSFKYTIYEYKVQTHESYFLLFSLQNILTCVHLVFVSDGYN
jgi:hypothetical protein